jgi:hypothetical protein
MANPLLAISDLPTESHMYGDTWVTNAQLALLLPIILISLEPSLISNDRRCHFNISPLYHMNCRVV